MKNLLRPGYNSSRMVRLIKESIERCRLDLTSKVVLTEAATGAYAVTPVIAAMAGAAKVYAITKAGRYGSRKDAVCKITELARIGDVVERIQFPASMTKKITREADIITNSGHLRPLDATKIGWMKSTAVIPLMYEAWELRKSDVDLEACQHKGIVVVATNEQHPAIDVFGYLGCLAMKQLMDAGIPVYKSKILLLSDNDFGSYIFKNLVKAGAEVDLYADLNGQSNSSLFYDAVLLAMRPRQDFNLSFQTIRWIARQMPGTIVVQFFGDLDRSACLETEIHVWPLEAPERGHMGILPSDIGPEATIRLQTGGLKAAEAAFRNSQSCAESYSQKVYPTF